MTDRQREEPLGGVGRRTVLKAAAFLPALTASMPHDGDSRADAASRVRVRAAESRRSGPREPQPANGDDSRYPTRIASFTKTLPHDRLGHVEPAAYDALLRALASGESSAFN